MATKTTLEIPLSEILQPFSEPTRKKVIVKIQSAGKPKGKGTIRIKGEALFEILQTHKNNNKRGLARMQENNRIRKDQHKTLIKTILSDVRFKTTRVIYVAYREQAKSKDLIPHSYQGVKNLLSELCDEKAVCVNYQKTPQGHDLIYRLD